MPSQNATKTTETLLCKNGKMNLKTKDLSIFLHQLMIKNPVKLCALPNGKVEQMVRFKGSKLFNLSDFCNEGLSLSVFFYFHDNAADDENSVEIANLSLCHEINDLLIKSS